MNSNIQINFLNALLADVVASIKVSPDPKGVNSGTGMMGGIYGMVCGVFLH